ncbi:MAG TPA: hypothetical protein VIY48_14960 [Candidatus Paceibacterota bacterium]|jgi:hypothetical protein
MITPVRMMKMLQESPDGISDEAVTLAELALAWTQEREMDVLDILYPDKNDAWKMQTLAEWEGQMRYVKDPEEGFDYSWETVKELLRDSYPEYIPGVLY